MNQTVSLSRLRVARDVTKYEGSSNAKFYWQEQFLCEAWYAAPDVRKIMIEQTWIGIERANAVSIAIGMAIEWLSEQG